MKLEEYLSRITSNDIYSDIHKLQFHKILRMPRIKFTEGQAIVILKHFWNIGDNETLDVIMKTVFKEGHTFVITTRLQDVMMSNTIKLLLGLIEEYKYEKRNEFSKDIEDEFGDWKDIYFTLTNSGLIDG